MNLAKLKWALLISLLSVCAALPAVANDWLYTVRPGDKLWNLAQRYCGSHTRWSDLAQHNQLANPNSLKPGSRLKFPIGWLVSGPTAAELIYVQGAVRLVRGASVGGNAGGTQATGTTPNEIEGALGSKLMTGDRIVTGAESFATVRFADKSQFNIGSDSEIVFDTLTAYGETGMVDTRVRMLRGGGQSTVVPQIGPGAVYHIGTPLGVAAVRGTDFRTRAQAQTSFVEMTSGSVRFDSTSGSQVDVERGKGLIANPGGVTVEELLAAPSFTTPPVELSQQEPLQWQPLAKAVEYVVTVAAADDATKIFGEQRITQTSYTPLALPPGDYSIGVRGVAASGLEGLQASHKAKVVLKLGVVQGVQVTQARQRRTFDVSWEPVPSATAYEVQLRPVVAGTPTTYTTSAHSVTISADAPGGYEVSVVAMAANVRGAASPAVPHEVARRRLWPIIVGALAALAIAL